MAEATRLIAEDQVRVAAHPAGIPALSENILARASEGDLDEQAALAREPQSSNGACAIAACSRAYRSFRASDCTYQPYTGPRQLCTKGSPGNEVENAAADAAPRRRRDPDRTFRVRRLFLPFLPVR